MVICYMADRMAGVRTNRRYNGTGIVPHFLCHCISGAMNCAIKKILFHCDNAAVVFAVYTMTSDALELTV